jgi:tetratricopeptide (TPR) repeat protein
VLLIVDYAETRAGLEDLLRAVLDDAGPVRVLLLARSPGEWWDRLAETSAPAIAALLGEQEPVRLDAPIAAGVPDADLAAAAVPYFAARLGVPAPDRVVFDLPAHRVPVLVLHAAALVAVLRSRTSPPEPSRVTVREKVLAELLVHEARYWRRAASAAGLPGDGPALKAVAAAAALLGAADLPEAARVAGRVPDLAGETEGMLRRWARWLYSLYPGGPDGRLGSVQPDLLAEHHVVTQLTASEPLAAMLLHGLSREQAEQALTVLARAWELHSSTGPVILAGLRSDLAGLAIAASQVAVRTRSDVGILLAQALADAPATVPDLIRIAEALPYPSLALAHADAAVTQRVHRELPPGTEPRVVAEWADRAGVRLSQIGHPAQALALTQEAIAIYRELAGQFPDRYSSSLARSLGHLGVRFSELGRPAEALHPAQEAVTIHRELAAAKPGQYHPDLAQSLHYLGVRLWELGRPAEALHPAAEAVTIYRELAAAIPDQYRHSLAASLSNLGIYFRELDRQEEALLPAKEAAVVFRELALTRPDQYQHGLAQSLHNLGAYLSELGHAEEALDPAKEAVAIRRELAAAMPDRHLPDLAQSLMNLGLFLSELGRTEEALPPTQEAVAMSRELAAARPDRERPGFAQTLTTLSEILTALGRNEEALPLAQEAVAIYRDLATAMPDRYHRDFAESLNTLGQILTALNRSEEAATARGEADGLHGPPH